MKKSVLLKAARAYQKARIEGNAARTDWKPDAANTMFNAMHGEGLTCCHAMAGTFIGKKVNKKSERIIVIDIHDDEVIISMCNSFSDYLDAKVISKVEYSNKN